MVDSEGLKVVLACLLGPILGAALPYVFAYFF